METKKRMRFGKLEIDPTLSPGVLDTATWDRDAAWSAVQAADETFWSAFVAAVMAAAPLPPTAVLNPYAASVTRHQNRLYCLAGLPDGQQLLAAIGPGSNSSPLGAPIGIRSWPAGSSDAQHVALYLTDGATLDRFFRLIAPNKGPRALGPAPRLGIGTRMTTAVWPAIWQAMGKGGFAANAIQNSVRELNFLETLLEGQPAERNIAFGFGTIETGYTGSSYEGLWVAGVLDALKHVIYLEGSKGQSHDSLRYGADADHIQVKRGADGLSRAKRLLEATRYYSFYTLDVSDVLDYGALAGRPGPAGLPDSSEWREIAAYHQPRRVSGFHYRPNDDDIRRLTGKYAIALDATQRLYEHLYSLKEGAPFDLELSIDEHPNEVPTFECLTSEMELSFVLLEARRRGIPLTHVAPNFGVEKGTDYRGADGLAGFEARTAALCRITEEFGIMPDFHSGDDLSAATRRSIGRATGGRNQFKVSPMLQLLFAEVLAEYHPDLFRRWYADALSYAQREAAAGSAFAVECIRKDQTLSGPPSSMGKGSGKIGEVFHHFSFAFVGRRDVNGQYICREEFYNLSPAFYKAYQECIVSYLLELADDLSLCK